MRSDEHRCNLGERKELLRSSNLNNLNTLSTLTGIPILYIGRAASGDDDVRDSATD